MTRRRTAKDCYDFDRKSKADFFKKTAKEFI